jgi:predicted glycogen debranching enzyme
LLVTATKPPVGRVVMLSKLEETFFIENEPFDLSANRYPGVVHPQGFRYLKQFRLDPFPVFTYEIEGIEIEKTVFMIHGENSTVVQYDLAEHNPSRRIQNLRLEVRPLIAFRDYHSTTHENVAINREIEQRPGLATIAPYQGLFIWRTALLSCEQQLSGTGTSSTMPNENVVSIFRKISSIPAFCVST